MYYVQSQQSVEDVRDESHEVRVSNIENKISGKFLPPSVQLKYIAKKFLKNNITYIYDYLDDYVYKQDKAKKQISLMLWTHLQRLQNPSDRFNKVNYLMLGPTGSGKTEICRALEEVSPVPVITIDCANVTAEGWKGASMSSVIKSEVERLKDPNLSEGAIFILDEADKFLIGAKSDNQDLSFSRQAQMLKMLEDGKILDSKGKVICNIQNATFIFAGAFSDVVDYDDSNSNSIIDKIIEAGMKPELAGRISNIIQVDPLDVDDYVYILKNMSSSYVQQSKSELKDTGLNITFTHGAIKYAAELAYKRNLGVRGANQILRMEVSDYVYDAIANGQRFLKVKKDDIK